MACELIKRAPSTGRESGVRIVKRRCRLNDGGSDGSPLGEAHRYLRYQRACLALAPCRGRCHTPAPPQALEAALKKVVGSELQEDQTMLSGEAMYSEGTPMSHGPTEEESERGGKRVECRE